jgi:hypothetical protein
MIIFLFWKRILTDDNLLIALPAKVGFVRAQSESLLSRCEQRKTTHHLEEAKSV